MFTPPSLQKKSPEAFGLTLSRKLRIMYLKMLRAATLLSRLAAVTFIKLQRF